jgi:hypothetical protein
MQSNREVMVISFQLVGFIFTAFDMMEAQVYSKQKRDRARDLYLESCDQGIGWSFCSICLPILEMSFFIQSLHIKH